MLDKIRRPRDDGEAIAKDSVRLIVKFQRSIFARRVRSRAQIADAICNTFRFARLHERPIHFAGILLSQSLARARARDGDAIAAILLRKNYSSSNVTDEKICGAWTSEARLVKMSHVSDMLRSLEA